MLKTNTGIYHYELLDEIAKKGHIPELLATGFFVNLLRTHVKELAEAGYLRDIVRDGSAIKQLIKEDQYYFHKIVQLGKEGIYVLVRNGYILELNEYYRNQLIDTLGFDEYAKLMHKAEKK